MTIPANVYLREVPAELLAGVSSREYEVVGSIIRSITSGKIVGHLQETSVLSNLLSNMPLTPLDLLSDAVTMVQNEQIKSAIQVVQSLEVANLALNTAAIGVSVAGTGILVHKLSVIESKIEGLQPTLDKLSVDVRELRTERIAEELTRLSTLLRQLDECWSLSQPEVEWRAIARDAHFLSDSFERRAVEIEQQDADPLTMLPFLEAFGLASMARITSRMACNDIEAALEAAKAGATKLINLGRRVQLAPLILERAKRSPDILGTSTWQSQLDDLESVIRPSVDLVRQREVAAASTVLTLDHISSVGIHGRDWLEAARNESQSPFIYLPVNE